MSIFEIFSKRQKRLRGDVPDVYTYDDIPEPLRVQIIHIWHDVLGGADQYDQQYLGTGNAYRFIVETLCREYGRFALAETNTFQTRHFLAEFAKFFLAEREPDKV